MDIGEPDSISALVIPGNATNKEVIWKSSNPKIVTVDEKGKVRAISAGTAVITCSAKDGSGKYATCTIKVINPVREIQLNIPKTHFIVGESAQFKSIVLPANATNKEVEWESRDEEVATIDEKGYLKAVGVGTTRIRCSSKYESWRSASCSVTVTDSKTLKSSSER